MDADKLHDRFRRWARDPSNNTLQLERYPASSAGALQMIEDAMLRAYLEGYRACKSDVSAALERLSSSSPDEAS